MCQDEKDRVFIHFQFLYHLTRNFSCFITLALPRDSLCLPQSKLCSNYLHKCHAALPVKNDPGSSQVPAGREVKKRRGWAELVLRDQATDSRKTGREFHDDRKDGKGLGSGGRRGSARDGQEPLSR